MVLQICDLSREFVAFRGRYAHCSQWLDRAWQQEQETREGLDTDTAWPSQGMAYRTVRWITAVTVTSALLKW